MNCIRESETARRPFEALPCTRPGMFDSLLRRQALDNAFVAINNLLATTATVRDVSPLDVIRICEEHRVDPLGSIAARLERLYADYLAWCLADRHLSTTELCDLVHLKAVLRISDTRAAALQQAAVVASGGSADESGTAFLQELQHDLGLAPLTAAHIQQARSRPLLQSDYSLS